MGQSFASLLSKNSSLDKLKNAVTAAGSNKFSSEEEGYWRLTTDKLGNGSAIIRFLPAPWPEQIPFGQFYRHAFKSQTGKWYIERSLTSLNEPDPLGEFNTKLWNLGDEDIKNQVRQQARKQVFVSNIYIVKDDANPSNVGKVFLFNYGKKIFEKIRKALEPEFGDAPFDPFHPIEGANFRLRQKKQANFPNYDDSTFESVKPLLDGDPEKLEEVFKQLKSISEITAPDKFKSYAELKKRLDMVMGFDTGVYLSLEQANADAAMRVGPSLPTGSATTSKSPSVWKPAVLNDVEEDESAKFSDDEI